MTPARKKKAAARPVPLVDYEAARLRAEVYSHVTACCSGLLPDQVEPFWEWVQAGACSEDRDLRIFCLEATGRHWNLSDAQKTMRRVEGLYQFATSGNPA